MTTATLFNQSLAPASAGAAGPAPPGVRRIVIVGGGTAGWMTALTLARSLLARGVEITLLESPQVGIIGVGEGSTPWLRGFFDSLGIEEAEWMPACHATYKCGISFADWSTRPGFQRYFHPFASMLDNLTMHQFVHNVDTRIKGIDLHAHPDRFFIATRLAAQRRAPKAAENFPFDIWHGYHFDAVLLGQFLQRKAIERGVRYQSGHVTHATLDGAGGIASVSTQEGADHRGGHLRRLQRLCRPSDREGAAYPLHQLRQQSVQRCGRGTALADGCHDPLRDGLDGLQARLGLEDPAHQPLRQRLCL